MTISNARGYEEQCHSKQESLHQVFRAKSVGEHCQTSSFMVLMVNKSKASPLRALEANKGCSHQSKPHQNRCPGLLPQGLYRKRRRHISKCVTHQLKLPLQHCRRRHFSADQASSDFLSVLQTSKDQ